MKKTVFILGLLACSLGLFAAPITVLASPFAPGDLRLDRAVRLVQADYPGTLVKVLTIDLSDGSTLTMDAMLAAGRAPDIYIDTIVRSSKYAVPSFALPLDGLVRDLDKYAPGVLDPFRKDGKLLCLPMPAPYQGMAVNLDIMAEIGYTVPERWTIADFLVMAEKVKQKYKGKKWATGMFAANQSGDYLINNWFFSFGTKFYEKGDYTKSVVSKGAGGAKTYAFFQDLARKGYVPPNATTLNDDDYCLEWSKGNLAATGFFASWMDSYWKSAIEQRLIDKPFAVRYVPFPRDPSVANVPSYSLYGTVTVHKTGTSNDKVAARIAEYFNDSEAQAYVVSTKAVSNRIDVKQSDDPYTAQVVAIVAAGGTMDVGLVSPRFNATRQQGFPVLQKVLALKITPEAAIKEYEAKINGALKE